MASELWRSPTVARSFPRLPPRGQRHLAPGEAFVDKTDGIVTNHTPFTATGVAFFAGAGSVRLNPRPPCPGRLRLPTVAGLPRASHQPRARLDTLVAAAIRSRRPRMALRSTRAAGHTQAPRL